VQTAADVKRVLALGDTELDSLSQAVAMEGFDLQTRNTVSVGDKTVDMWPGNPLTNGTLFTYDELEQVFTSPDELIAAKRQLATIYFSFVRGGLFSGTFRQFRSCSYCWSNPLTNYTSLLKGTPRALHKYCQTDNGKKMAALLRFGEIRDAGDVNTLEVLYSKYVSFSARETSGVTEKGVGSWKLDTWRANAEGEYIWYNKGGPDVMFTLTEVEAAKSDKTLFPRSIVGGTEAKYEGSWEGFDLLPVGVETNPWDTPGWQA